MEEYAGREVIKMVVLNDVKNPSKTSVIVHGVGNQTQMKQSTKKGIKNALDALDSGVLPGHGWMYMLLAERIRDAAISSGGKEGLAMDGVAEAMENMYKTLVRNAGHNPIDAYVSAKKLMSDGNDVEKVLPAGMFLSMLQRSMESVISMLRTDEVLSVKPLYKTEGFGGSSSGVTVYTSDGCPWCARTKEYLKSRGVSFREVNVSRDPSGIQEMMSVSGQTGTPVTVIKGEAVVGFDEARLGALI